MSDGLCHQAKILTEPQQRAVLNHVSLSRHAARDRVIVLLSMKAGFRACEIAALTWSMVTNADGILSDEIRLENTASKGKRGGRIIPMHPEVLAALLALHGELWPSPRLRPERPVIYSERAKGYTPATIAQWFHRLYATLGMKGASSHSGRRTFATRAARKIVEAGGSLRDVQALMGHASIQTTQRYVDECEDAKRRVVAMI
jgi:integrase/recombinase XerD